MLKNRTKPLGYLLKLLKISSTTLASVIHVDRTLVNKWVLGTRKFDLDSKYYELVVKYIIEENEKKGGRILNKFFSNIYPDIAVTDAYLQSCLDRFLASIDIPSNAYCLINEAENSVYYSSVPVFKTMQGRFQVIMDLLGDALSSDQKEEILLFDVELFEWIFDCDSYAELFKKQVATLLDHHHDVIFVCDTHHFQAYAKFANLTQGFLPYENCHLHYSTFDFELSGTESQYMIWNRTVIYGSRMENGEMYSIVLRDPLSLSSASQKAKKRLEKCSPCMVVRDNPKRYEIFEKICRAEEADELSYLYTPALSFITMSRGLLDEVLYVNKVLGRERKRILQFYDAHAASMQKESDTPLMRHMCCYERIKEVLTLDRYYFVELTGIVGRKMYMTHGMVARHIQDTIQILRNSKNYCMGFLRLTSSFNQDNYSSRTMRNHYFIAYQKVLKYIEELELIKNTILINETEWAKNIPDEYKDNGWVANKLEGLLRET